MNIPLRRAINCTGVVLHTGLGRAPLGAKVIERTAELITGYCNLEFELETGKRGHRDNLVTDLLNKTTGAEASLIVNNNAAAVMLVLRALARGKKAAVARSQLIEIGGSFRLPDILEAGGVELSAVGSVNRCTADDYREALDRGAALILLAHKSNFAFTGEYEEPGFEELAKLADEYDVPYVIDLGGGLLDQVYYPTLHLYDELSVRHLLESGIELVTFSGDKLLGGPQAGIIVGKQELVDILKKNQMLRALRAGKETYALLTAVLELYAAGCDALNDLPTFRMLNRGAEECREIAESLYDDWLKGLPAGCEIELASDVSLAGGGTLPALRIPTTVIRMKTFGTKPAALSDKLRAAEPPIVVRSSGDYIVFDPRTLTEDDVNQLKSLPDIIGKVLRP